MQHNQTADTKNQFVEEAAHDFNNLMGVILGYCELLEDQATLSAPAREIVVEIHNAGVSAKDLAQRLLALSRGQVLQHVPLDLNDIVSRVKKMLSRLTGKDVQLASSLGRGLGKINANPGQLEEVLMNLILNARDAMQEGGIVLIETANLEIDETKAGQDPSTRPGQYVALTVSDTGSGMARETQSHMFEPFFSTKSPGRGRGLGLSMVSSVVEQCGGTIAVFSEPGSGTTFRICFPRCDDAPSVMAQQETHPAPGGTETILLVDDSAPLRKLMRRFLAGSGYTVLDSGDPGEALCMAKAYPGPIPLMITDVRMPGLSGSVLAEQVAAVKPGNKVLYMSGYPDDLLGLSRDSGQELTFLAKPFSSHELLTEVRLLLGPKVKHTC
jgi:CheY-like chemotaxis protein